MFGDTNSTLAASLVANRLSIPLAHVEAGLRSFNRDMPEELNRILVDKISDLLFCPSDRAVKNLKNEGLTRDVFLTGDVMYDSVLAAKNLAKEKSNILRTNSLASKNFSVVTIHRASNTDDRETFKNILLGLNEIGKKSHLIFPLHPRAKKMIDVFGLSGFAQNIKFIEPVSYLDMIKLLSNAQVALTDSGGMQKEAYFLQTPCVTIRNETEWVETLSSKANTLVKADAN